jgi:hypothetical protein
VPFKAITVLGPPVLVCVVVVVGYLAIDHLTGLEDLELIARVAIKAVYAGAGYLILSLGLQPKTTRSRVTYVWRLVRQVQSPLASI